MGQSQVRTFLRACISGNRVSHAYLFTGPAGSNKTQAAYSFAQSIICPQHGTDNCDACRRVVRRKHPDVRYFAPEGAAGYLVEQVREIVSDVSLAPIQAQKKVYIIDRVDLMGVQPANAFLKTLEEPPDDVVLILLGRTRESVLPTIVSRCQVVPFRHIPASEAAAIVAQHTGATKERAAIAIQACGGSITNGIAFVKSSERFEFRSRLMDVMESLYLADDLDVLDYATDLLDRSKAPLDVVRAGQEHELEESSDYLAKSVIRQIELRNKRALAAKNLQMLDQMAAIVRSWLRDVLMVCAHTPELVINIDRNDGLVEAAGRTTMLQTSAALREVDRSQAAFRYNVSPETCIDAMLLQIREVLYGPDRTGNPAI